MMIIDYDSCYAEDVKDLLVELQEYIASLDKEGFNITTPSYREEYFKKTLSDVENQNGKILLCKNGGKIVGLVVGLLNEPISTYDFRTPRRGSITELIVTKNCREKGVGKSLLNAMEEHLKSRGCEHICIEVFGYNQRALEFYERNGYHMRVVDVIKNVKK